MSDWPDEDVHETADELLGGLGADRALGYAVVAFTPEGCGGVGYAVPGGGKMEMMAEVQLVSLMLNAVADSHGAPPEETAETALAMLAAEDALNSAESLASLLDVDADGDADGDGDVDVDGDDWTDVDIEDVGEDGTGEGR